MYFYGAASPQDNPELYRSYVERLAAVLEEQAAASLEVSGMQASRHRCNAAVRMSKHP